MKRIVFILALIASPLWAVQPDEMLDDPVLEDRAREISQGIRCPVCQNESIDESSATLAGELRIVLRERLVAGDSDQEVVDYLVARYGEFVLLNPTKTGANLILWLSAPVMLLLALAIGFVTLRRKTAPPEALSAEEKAALDEIMRP
ncbi:cytochrome c-type biogenesis protein CcmH [Cognatiyoonia koreensis]|uniref:Cytochrome c-type biogenesis protein n=1 Tax=Cognatiyoonia koreensis TaxID=364200 RepID=A0A1I0PKW0_9RHOB|nr:cytochrome c-type biogenesis protein [Cognatiyoonia koreensis]SEW15040.1 cytochrome c-type biogenesis protein CcmH [Cognatiyoonia koreensis]